MQAPVFELITDDRKYLIYKHGLVKQVGLDDRPIAETKLIIINKLPILLNQRIA